MLVHHGGENMPEGEAQFLWQKYEATGHIMVATGRRKWDQRQGQLKASNVSLTFASQDFYHK